MTARDPIFFIGIDPGKKGAISALKLERATGQRSIVIIPMPKGERDIANHISAWAPCNACAVIERAHAMPGQGVTSMFSYGEIYGFLRGCLTSYHIPFTEVLPQVWQKSFGLVGRGGDKWLAVHKAEQLWPNEKITKQCGDSVLIAEYARKCFWGMTEVKLEETRGTFFAADAYRLPKRGRGKASSAGGKQDPNSLGGAQGD